MKIKMLLRDTLRKGYRAKGRFLSLFGIIAISSAFFAGLKVTGGNMKESAEEYYNNTGLMDLHLLSNVGFSEGDLQLLAENADIRQMYGGYSETVFLPVSEDAANEIVQIYSLPEGFYKDGAAINQPVLTEGRMPEQANECLIEVNTPKVFQVGDTLTVTVADADSTLLAETAFQIVGRADWSMYTDFSRGTTTIGNGSIDSFLLVPAEAFDAAFYTDVFLTLTETADINSFSDRYLTVVSDAANALTGDVLQYSALRAAELQAEAEKELQSAREELDDGWTKYNDGEAELEAALADARQQLADAEQELADGRAALDEQWQRYHESLANYENSNVLLSQREKTIEAREQQANGAIAEITEQMQPLDRIAAITAGYRGSAMEKPYPADLQAIIDTAAAYDTQEFSLSDALDSYFAVPVRSEEKAALEQAIEAYIDNTKSAMQKQIEEIQYNAQQLVISRSSLESAQIELAKGKQSLDTFQEELNAREADYTAGKAEYETQKAELEQTEQEERQALADAKQELEDGEADYAEAVAAVADIPAQITWYAFDRSDNPGWSSYGEDADRVDRIARVFPVFFLLVAALVCLTTMTRMVEEQRTEIGTCKALGYSAAAISVQFLLYAAIASVLGVGVGTLVGFQVFPRVIFTTYQMMYHYPAVACPYHWGYALGCLGAALLCTGITALAACRAALQEVPAMLMRPKPPKQGKRILLERWKWLWSKCSFHVKVTIRNFFRYRSRVLMTILGICGCTALLLTGFGLYHAVAAIVDLQYEEVFVYDILGLYDETEENRAVLEDTLEHTAEITGYQFGMFKSGTIRANHKSYEVTIMIPERSEEFAQYVVMRDRKTHESYTLRDDGIMINEKLAKLLGVQAGDSVTLTDGAKPVPITAVVENYAMNRVIMTQECCRALFGEYQANCVFANEMSETDENALAEHLLKTDALLRLEFTSQSGNNFRELVKALGYVVVLVIVFSGLLAFVVLYNLANINILERMRELATLKVLGFYDNEVGAYIFRENVLSAFFGMLAGLLAGIFLCRYVVQTAEVDVVMFAPDIPWYCFVAAALVTMLFTFLVNGLLSRKLKAIDMAGSMKAIE